ncbi:MAG: flagellar motor switch protein FliN [Dehalococcoidia bacterium]
MATSEALITARVGERLRAALPAAISEAFGGRTETDTIEPGILADLLSAFDDGYHLHLEMDAAAARYTGQPLALFLRPEEAARLFDLEPTDPTTFGDPGTQLRVLSEFSEGAEALAGSLAGSLTGTGVITALSLSGASLEEAPESPAVASALFGGAEPTAFRLTLSRPPGPAMVMVVALSADLTAAFAGDGQVDTAPVERPDSVGEPARRAPERPEPVMDAPRRATEPPPYLTPVPPTTLPPPAKPPAPVTAHPFMFGQLDTPAAAPRQDRNVDLILDVSLHVRVELGSTRMTVAEVLALGPGSVVELDRLAGEPVDIVVNDRLIARGEVVVVEENFGVRVTEILAGRSRTAAGV